MVFISTQEFSSCYSSDSLPDFSAGVGMSEGLKRLACWLGLNNKKNEDGSNPNEIFFPVFFFCGSVEQNHNEKHC